jgi:hypothetical protein
LVRSCLRLTLSTTSICRHSASDNFSTFWAIHRPGYNYLRAGILVAVHATLGFSSAIPPPSSLILARPGDACAGNAADRAIAAPYKRVMRKLPLGKPSLDILCRP